MTNIDALESILGERYSCRGFTDEPVAPEPPDRAPTDPRVPPGPAP